MFRISRVYICLNKVADIIMPGRITHPVFMIFTSLKLIFQNGSVISIFMTISIRIFFRYSFGFYLLNNGIDTLSTLLFFDIQLVDAPEPAFDYKNAYEDNGQRDSNSDRHQTPHGLFPIGSRQLHQLFDFVFFTWSRISVIAFSELFVIVKSHIIQPL